MVLTANQNEIPADSKIWVNASPIEGYVDMLAVSGKKGNENAPASEDKTLTEQSKKISIRRKNFQDTDNKELQNNKIVI